MKTTGIVYEDTPSLGAAPLTIVDRSRYKQFTQAANITTRQLPSRLWVYIMNGVNSLIDNNDLAVLPLFITMSFDFWFAYDGVYADGTTHNCLRIAESANNQFLFGKAASNQWLLRWRGAAASKDCVFDDASYADGGYHHVAGVRMADTNLQLYLDGLMVDDNLTGSNDFTAAPINIYYGATNGGEHWDGRTALLRLMSRPMSAAEILRRFEATRHWFGV